MSSRVIRSASERKIIDRLHALRRKVGLENGIKYRAEFIALAFQHGLVKQICSYQLWDEGWEDLGERTFDTCFEMGDSKEVIAMVVTRARNEGFLDSIREYCTVPEDFERWLGYADGQMELF